MASPYSHYSKSAANGSGSWMPSANMLREEPQAGSVSPAGWPTPPVQAPVPSTAGPAQTLDLRKQIGGLYNVDAHLPPEMVAHKRKAQMDYAAQFPQGYTAGMRMTPEQIHARNRYLNVQATFPTINEFGLGVAPTAPYNPNLFTDIYVPDASYGNRLQDSFRRIGNRFGGDYQLDFPDDPYLDWSSYALEAAPQIAATALTFGGSAGAQAAAQGTRLGLGSRAGQIITRGMQPFAQGSRSPLMRFAGRNIPAAANFAASPLNPVPFILGTLGARGVGSALANSWLRSMAMQGAAYNYANAYRDQAAMDPYSGIGQRGKELVTSLASGVRADPGYLFPLGRMGLSPTLLGDVATQNLQPEIDSLMYQDLHPVKLDETMSENPRYLDIVEKDPYGYQGFGLDIARRKAPVEGALSRISDIAPTLNQLFGLGPTVSQRQAHEAYIQSARAALAEYRAALEEQMQGGLQ